MKKRLFASKGASRRFELVYMYIYIYICMCCGVLRLLVSARTTATSKCTNNNLFPSQGTSPCYIRINTCKCTYTYTHKNKQIHVYLKKHIFTSHGASRRRIYSHIHTYTCTYKNK